MSQVEEGVDFIKVEQEASEQMEGTMPQQEKAEINSKSGNPKLLIIKINFKFD